ncbi:hypothetical protein CR513_07985, partial [Mucuna pruriens]
MAFLSIEEVQRDQLDYQRILVDLILSILASGGEPSPSTMAIVVEDGIIECRPCSAFSRAESKSLCRDHLVSLSAEGISASAETNHHPTLRFCITSTTKNKLIKLAPLRGTQLCTDNSVASSNIFAKPVQMENNDGTLKELATPDVVYQPWCIQYPQLEPAQTYELKSGLIHLLPKFHGLVGEDPHKHLKEFHVVCSAMRPQGIPEDYIKMKEFPFSLDGATKDWLYLQPVLINTWGDMKRMFLEKFFLTSRTATIRKEICGIRQHTRETLHEYWERFNKICATCPHHQISEQLLIQYFYQGLSMMDRSMIDASSGGALMDKTPTTARHLIFNMASNTQ